MNSSMFLGSDRSEIIKKKKLFSFCCIVTEEVIKNICYFYWIWYWFITVSKAAYYKGRWFIHWNLVSDFFPYAF